MEYKNTLAEIKVKLINLDRELNRLTHQNDEVEIEFIHKDLVKINREIEELLKLANSFTGKNTN